MASLILNQKFDQNIKLGFVWYEQISLLYGHKFEEAEAPNKSKAPKVELENNSIIAKAPSEAYGSGISEIKFSKLDSDTISKLTKYFDDNPVEVINLALIGLESQLIWKLKEAGINIFPESLADIEINCCEKQHLCSHVDLILQNVAKQINKNLELVFTLRGISISEIISNAGFLNLSEEITLNHLSQHQSASVDEMDELPLSKEVPEFEPLDTTQLYNFISQNPVHLSRGNHRLKLLEIIEAILEEIDFLKNHNNPIRARRTDFYLIESGDDLNIFATPVNYFLGYLKSKGSRLKYSRESMEVPVIDPETKNTIFVKKEGLLVSKDIFFDYLLSVYDDPQADTDTESINFLKNTAKLSINLLKSALFIPQIALKNDSTFTLKYFPFLANEKVKHALLNYYHSAPEQILLNNNLEPIAQNNVGNYIISEFITYIIEKIFFLKPSKIKNNVLLAPFIKSRDFNMNSFNDKKMAESLHEWLKPLSFQKDIIKSVLRLEPLNDGTNFKLHLGLAYDNNLEEIVPFAELFKNSENIFDMPVKLVKTKVCRQLFYASEYMPIFSQILNSKGLYFPILNLRELSELVLNMTSFLNQLGIDILLPKELQNFSKIKLSLQARSKSGIKDYSNILFGGEDPNSISLDKIMEFSYEIAIGDQVISKEEFLKLVEETDGIVKIKDNYLILKSEEIDALIKKLNQPPLAMTHNEFLMAGMTGVHQETDFNTDEAIKNALMDYSKSEDISIPETLNGTLRPYQERGFQWMYSNNSRGFGSCIADDMGLGKTIQVLSFILKLKEEKKLTQPALVICPTTLLGNWVKECEKFTPSLNVSIYHGNDRELNLKNIDILITTYAIARIDNDKITAQNWYALIIDEAQNIKNPDTAQSKAIKNIRAQKYIAITGTPVENKLLELWSIFDFANKGYLGSKSEFQNTYSMPIEKFRDEDKINRLKKVISPFILRRLKTDKSIIDDLPDKIIIDEFCYLTKDQAALYEKTLQESIGTIKTNIGIGRKGQIFKLITALKQICNHPAHYTKSGAISRELSGKADTALTIIENIIENNEKAIIFSQYKQMGQILVDMLKKELDQEALFFHGSLSREKREDLIETFQTNNENKLMILSLKAGGTGLNLTTATNVIHYDLWWNPAVEDQATDRTYRIGQTKNVNVHRLITLGTFEEKIDAKIKSKKELANLTIGSGENWLSELSDTEIKDLFSLSF